MAPKSKGTKINLRDLQRELQPGDALPIAPRPAEEREEERERKWSRYEKEAAGGSSGRWADRDVDGDSDGEWRRDSRPPKKEEVEVDFRGARGAKFQPGGPSVVDEDAGFANLRRGGGPASSASGLGGPKGEGRKMRDDEDVDFSTVRAQARKPLAGPKSPQGEEADFCNARSGAGLKRDAARGPAGGGGAAAAPPRGGDEGAAPPAVVDFSSARSGGPKRAGTAAGAPPQAEVDGVDFASARSGGPKRGIREDSDLAFSHFRTGNKQQAPKIEPDPERARGLRDVVAAVFAGGAAPAANKRDNTPPAPAPGPATTATAPPAAEAPRQEPATAAAAAARETAETTSSTQGASAAAAPATEREQQKQQQKQQQEQKLHQEPAKKSTASTPPAQKARDSTSPSSTESGREAATAKEPAATAAAAPSGAASAAAQPETAAETAEPVEKFIPKWKRQQKEAEAAAPKPSVREEPVVLEPIKLSSLRGAGASTGLGIAAAGGSSSKTAAGETKYIPPCLRKDPAATGALFGASSLHQQQNSGTTSAVRKLLGNANAAREAAAAAEAAEKKKQQEQAEARKQQLLEKQRQQEKEQQRVQQAFRCSDDEALHAFVSRAQELLKETSTATPAEQDLEACVSLLPEADRGSLAAPLCLIGLVFRAGFEAKTSQDVRTKAQPLVPLIRRLLKEARDEMPQGVSTLIIQQLVILANELRCPRLSADTALVEAVFDFLLLENLIPQKDFVAWLEDADDDTPGRTAVMFQITSWGLWLRGELGPVEEPSESEEDNDDDIEALVPKRNFVKISRRLR